MLISVKCCCVYFLRSSLLIKNTVAIMAIASPLLMVLLLVEIKLGFSRLPMNHQTLHLTKTFIKLL